MINLDTIALGTPVATSGVLSRQTDETGLRQWLADDTQREGLYIGKRWLMDGRVIWGNDLEDGPPYLSASAHYPVALVVFKRNENPHYVHPKHLTALGFNDKRK